MDFDIRDLQAIAGLASMSGDQNASAAARQFLAEQSLQERRIKAQEQIERARNAIQTSQFDKDLAFRTAQAGEESSRFKEGIRVRERERAEDRATNEFQFGVQAKQNQDQLDATKAYQSGQLKLGQAELDLKRKEMVHNRAMDFLRLSSNASRAAGGGLSIPEAIKDLTGLPESISSLIMKAQKGDENALAQASQLAQMGYAVMGGSGQLEVSPKGAGAEQILNAYRMATADLSSPEDLAAFESKINNMSLEDKAGLGLLGPEEQKEILKRAGEGLARSLISGSNFTADEQQLNKALWDTMASSEDKLAVLDGIAAIAAVRYQEIKGWDDSRAAEIREAVDLAMQAAAESTGRNIAKDLAITLDALPGQPTNSAWGTAKRAVFGAAAGAMATPAGRAGMMKAGVTIGRVAAGARGAAVGSAGGPLGAIGGAAVGVGASFALEALAKKRQREAEERKNKDNAK